MPLRIVQSKQNARLKELRRALTFPGREGHGLAGIEGSNLIEEALKAGLPGSPAPLLRRVFEHLLETLPLPPETEILLMKREIPDSSLATQTPQPVAALVELPDWTWAHILEHKPDSVPLVAVLAGIQDPGKPGHHSPALQRPLAPMESSPCREQ